MSTGSRDKRPSPLNENALRQLIRVAIEKGYYTESLHHPERNISVDDVIHGVERSDWSLIGNPEWCQYRHTYKYQLSTVDIDGDELTIIIAGYSEGKRIEFIMSCLSWNWRGRSSVKITERTHAKRAKTLHRRGEGGHSTTAL